MHLHEFLYTRSTQRWHPPHQHVPGSLLAIAIQMLSCYNDSRFISLLKCGTKESIFGMTRRLCLVKNGNQRLTVLFRLQKSPSYWSVLIIWHPSSLSTMNSHRCCLRLNQKGSRFYQYCSNHVTIIILLLRRSNL